MRHIGTLIAAIVIGPLAWILIAFGQDRSATAFANAQKNSAFHTGDFVRPLIFLAAAGLILGLVATLRLSPLGAGLMGLVYALSYVWLFIDAKGLLDLFKHNLSIGGQTADPTTPVKTGTTLLIGALLLVSVASTSRWRRRARLDAVATPAVPAGTGTDAGEPYGLGTGDPSMFRSETAVPVGAGVLSGSGSSGGSGSTGESTESIPAQSKAGESEAARTPTGSPWSTPLRDESDK